MRTKQLVDCPPHVVYGVTMTKKTIYGNDPTRKLQVGDRVQFTCDGRGRGGHYGVEAIVTKVNRATFNAVECPNSYKPNAEWNVSLNNSSVILHLPYVSSKD